ncbi:putative thioesterase [Clostridium tetanomorphum]|uniref:Thioesterase family protein n=1 Tax=Clostridium tetanomorphum TaxID=1553 RepID=A0A923J3D8_CLOTT|nr:MULTISPECIES: thioesterase family protein [Clostridium]KAJ52747.1 dihydrolipoamide acyltransferase [Clostridium tetanomorphum DSM 665]MBC2400030.1 thioesterase family protein [Clostridium tetanomorphum]MBC2425520.1 thioesterase family protein [Clostridium beijerinckii]MBP1866478.1 putative thioesterase [Clostridium tetanomorphum]NRS86400.1 putative thioesterase [Clostridium tetanomorphum]
MECNLKEGISSVMEIKVTEKETAISHGSGDLPVYATPAMIALMENTARSCVGLHLQRGYTTVGIEVSVKHVKATPMHMKVKSEATLVKVEGKKLFFKVMAWDEKGKIGEGTHTRYIVNGKEFVEKLK